MTRSRSRRAASRRGRSREASPVPEDAQVPQREESNEDEAPDDAAPPRRSARKKRGSLSPSQTTLTSFFPKNNRGDPSSGEPKYEGAGDSQDEDTNEEKEISEPRNEQDQDFSTQSKNDERTEASKEEEKSEQAKVDPQEPLASPPDLEADKNNKSAGAREENVSSGLETTKREVSSHQESSAAISQDSKDDPISLEDHGDVGQHGTSPPAFILPSPSNEITEANVHLPKSYATAGDQDRGRGVCMIYESQTASLEKEHTNDANNAPRDESSEGTPSSSPQDSNVYFGGNLMSRKIESTESGSAEVERIRSEQPETLIVPLDSKISFEGTVCNDREKPLKLSASPQVSFNPLDMLSQVSVSIVESRQVLVPSRDDESSLLLKQEGQKKIDANSEPKVTASHYIPDQQRVENNSTYQPPNEAALNPKDQRIPQSSGRAAPSIVERAGISMSQQSQTEVNMPIEDSEINSNADGGDKGGTNVKRSDGARFIHSFGGEKGNGSNDAEGSDTARQAVTNQNGMGPTLIGQGSAALSSQEKSLDGVTKVHSVIDKQLAVDGKCAVAVASSPLVETHSLNASFAKTTESAGPNVKDTSSDGAREHSLNDAQEDGGVRATCRGGDIPTPIASSLVQVSSQTQDTTTKMAPQHEPSPPAILWESKTAFLDVEDMKIRLYDIGSRVHRGKRPERRFAAYWEALSCFVSSRVHPGVRSTRKATLDGVRKVLDSFLKTKQMRKLHNLLIMGLMKLCTKDYVIDNGIRNHIPEVWQDKIRTHRGDVKPTINDTAFTPVPVAEALSDLDLSPYNLFSDMWTAAGREPLMSHSVFSLESSNALAARKEIAQLPRHAPCLPGALWVDPIVRRIVRDDSMKVSETAIWVLVVAVREYVRSLLNGTISSLETVATQHSLGALDFSQCALRSGSMGTTKAADSATDAKQNGSNEKSVVRINQVTGQKRRAIRSLDIAATLSRTRIAPEGSLAGSVQPLAYERCCHVSFNGSFASPPPAFASVQSFIVDSIQSASKKPKHEWNDPTPVAAADPDSSNAAKSSRKAISGSSHSPPDALGMEAKNLAELRARAAAMVVAPEPESIPIAPVPVISPIPPTVPFPAFALAPPTVPQTTAAADSISAGQLSVVVGESVGAVAVIRPKPIEENRTASISPRGRGRGFGVKNLAAMRARSVPISADDNQATERAPSQQECSIEQKPERAQTTNSPVQLVTKQNGTELRRLQEVQLRNNVPDIPSIATEGGDDTSPIAHPSTADEAKGVSFVPVQGNADATQEFQ